MQTTRTGEQRLDAKCARLSITGPLLREGNDVQDPGTVDRLPRIEKGCSVFLVTTLPGR